MELREYQKNLVGGVRNSMLNGKTTPLIVLPTGGGKTVIFSHFTSKIYEAGQTIYIMAHRKELLHQISETLTKFKVPFSYIARGYPYDPKQKVQVCSVQTLARRYTKIPKPNFIICDEAHHCTPKTQWGKIINYYKTRTIGVTATPCRLSGEPLGDIFDDILIGPSTKELIDMQYLSPFKYYAPSKLDTSSLKITSTGDYNQKQMAELVSEKVIVGSVINEYRKHAPDKRAIIYAPSVEYAYRVAEEFQSSGIPSGTLEGSMDDLTRNYTLKQFRQGKIKVLTNCQIATEGLDVPAIEAVIMLRPTASLSLFLQMVGRGLRIFEGKNKAIILDHVENYKTHGLPDSPRDWSLDGEYKSKQTENNFNIVICPECFFAQPKVSVCVACGFEFTPKKPRGEISNVEGVLEEIQLGDIKPNKRAEQARCRTFEELVDLGKKRNYKNPQGWAMHVLKSRRGKRYGDKRKKHY